jgi:hypothetical protein
MPRGGPPTNLYTLPPIYLAVPGTTILAAQQNSPLEDIALTLNDPWPVNIGGTGGTSLITSWDSLNSRGTDIPTAATLDLDAATGANDHLTGSVTVTAVSLSNGRVRQGIVADSAFLITAGASLVVNGYSTGNIAVPAGTVLTFVGSTAGVVYVAFSDSAAASFVGYTTTATAAGTTTLTAASTYQQYFTGVTTQTVTLPVTSTLNLGFGFRIVNNSTGIVTVNSSGANAVVAMQPATQAIVTCILTSGTTAASWSITYIPVTSNANSNTILVADGTVSLPAYSFSGDPNTGTYRIGVDNIGIAANGAKVLDIGTTGLGVTGVGTGTVGFIDGYTTTATAAGTTTLTATSTIQQFFTGATTQTVVLPVTSTLALGWAYRIFNSSTGAVTVQSSGANSIVVIPANSSAILTCILTSGTSAASWSSAASAGVYAEGAWTPAMTFNASSTGITYSTQTGQFTKIGLVVYAQGRITLTNNGSGVGVAVITSFPFTASANAVGKCFLIAGGSAATGIYLVMGGASTSASLYIPGAVADAAATDTNCTNTFSIDFSVTYLT